MSPCPFGHAPPLSIIRPNQAACWAPSTSFFSGFCLLLQLSTLLAVFSLCLSTWRTSLHPSKPKCNPIPSITLVLDTPVRITLTLGLVYSLEHWPRLPCASVTETWFLDALSLASPLVLNQKWREGSLFLPSLEKTTVALSFHNVVKIFLDFFFFYNFNIFKCLIQWHSVPALHCATITTIHLRNSFYLAKLRLCAH